MLRLPGVFSFLALLWAAGLAHADSIATFAFTGTLETPLANQTSVTGQFTVDLTTRAVNAFSFVTPIGTIDAGQYEAPAGFAGQQGSAGDSLVVLDLNSRGAGPGAYLRLAFVGFPDDRFATTFVGGLLYTGPIANYPFGPYLYASVACNAGEAACSSTGYSRFLSGSATPLLAPVPEPTTLALLSCGFVLLGWAWPRQRGPRGASA